MTLVYGTVSTIDRTAVCQDPECAQFGELMENHRVVHRAKMDKGKKGECPFCGAKLHNWHDSDLTIQVNCLWRQAFKDEAKDTDPSAANLDKVSTLIKEGKIKEWATLAKVRELTAKVKGITLPAPRGSATASSTTPAATGPAPTTTPSMASAGASATVAVTPTAAPSVGAASVQPAGTQSSGKQEVPEDVKRKLAAIMGGARVSPSL